MGSFASEFVEGARVGVPMAALVFGAFSVYAVVLSLFYPEVTVSEAVRVALVGDAAAAVIGSALTLFVSLWSASQS